ncbi:MAG: endonuclease domain-containing protein [Brachybacterium sp.]|nr:endonuclease domain-containing protein [Brachybacterium sp.]
MPELDLVLEHAGRCLPAVKVAILLESALNRGQLSMSGAQRIVASLPFHAARSLSRVRGDAESGTETAVRWWFESRGVPVRAQVSFPDDARRMDLLVGRSWVIECDSREHHADEDSYEKDRVRDLHLSQKGYDVTRLSWRQVFLTWPTTERSLLVLLGRGEHLRPPTSRRGALLQG